MKLAAIVGKAAQQPPMRRNLLLAGALATVLVLYLAAENALSAGSHPPVLPQRSVATVADAPRSDDGYFLKEYNADPAPAVGEPGWALVADVIVKLAIVLGLIYGAARLLRRFVNTGRLGLPTSGKAIAVLEATQLGPNRSLYLVSVGGKVLLLGATAAQLSTLTEFSDPAHVAELRGTPPTEKEPSFQQQLDDALVTDQPTDSNIRLVPDPLAEGRDFLQRQIAEIQRIATPFRRS